MGWMGGWTLAFFSLLLFGHLSLFSLEFALCFAYRIEGGGYLAD
jgi:hypothetical protein